MGIIKLVSNHMISASTSRLYRVAAIFVAIQCFAVPPRSNGDVISGGVYVLPTTHAGGRTGIITYADFNKFDASFGQLSSVLWTMSYTIGNLSGWVANASSSYNGIVDVHENSVAYMMDVPGASDEGIPGRINFNYLSINTNHLGAGSVYGASNGFNPFVVGPGSFFFSFPTSMTATGEGMVTSSLASYIGSGTLTVQPRVYDNGFGFQGQGPDKGHILVQYDNTSTLEWDGSQTVELLYNYVPVPEPTTLILATISSFISIVGFSRFTKPLR